MSSLGRWAAGKLATGIVQGIRTGKISLQDSQEIEETTGQQDSCVYLELQYQFYIRCLSIVELSQ